MPPGAAAHAAGRSNANSPAKQPIEKGGFHNATIDLSMIEKWWGRDRYNIGLATAVVSLLVVLDVDPRHGGEETLAELETRYGELPATWRFLTGGKVRYAPVLSWRSRGLSDRFSAAVIKLLLRDHPSRLSGAGQ
jgi:hypothetical protein